LGEDDEEKTPQGGEKNVAGKVHKCIMLP